MNNLKINQIINADFKVSKSSPILRPFGGSIVVADPSLLTPENSHDGKWHMFFHTTFGVWHFRSNDGISFERVKKVANRAMRPNINFVDGKYYLFYERTRPLIMNGLNVINAVKWKSEIYVIESTDLINWSEPKPVITNTRDFERSERGMSISNPFLLRENGINRLYYSCGLTFIKDCGFCEPTYINYAESEKIADGYVSAEKPIISPDKNNPYLNLCSGCLKVYKLADGYIGIQNGLYERNGKSHSAIILLTSADGLSFEFKKVLVEPCVVNGKDWMKQFVYASHLVKHGNKLRLYFNARDTSDMLKGRECIGFTEAEIV
ncbi:MAG: glycosyl hydrolase family 43 [Clostridia bacterium]|nr:glycosyl hydrolase family 43 [Clostridia bacterium]